MNTNREGRTQKSERHVSYSPSLRTALVLCGTGAHGAYHAGALKALLEAGVKIDVVAGQGVGAGAAALAAIDGAMRLWEPGGVWRHPGVSKLYGWRWPLRVTVWLAGGLAVIFLVPLLLLALAALVFLSGFVLEMLRTGAGTSIIAGYSSWLQNAFAGENLPTIVPRLVTMILAVILLVLFVGATRARWRPPLRRRAMGAAWWRLFGAPLNASGAYQLFAGAISQLIRGAAPGVTPSPATLGRRYADVLAEGLGQPGFRELMMIVTDLDARRDLVAALLREPYGRDFMASRPGQERRAEALDLFGAGRDHALDILAAALTPPLACEPHVIAFASDSFWQGEAHRLCDRPAAILRLLEELSGVGVAQAIVVSGAAAIAKPHRLAATRLDLRSRLGETLSASESATLRDALELGRRRFDCLHLICPAHNPVGAFDFGGAYDEASDRRQDLPELMERGYEDAYRQFIEPAVGASGEQLVTRIN